MATGLQDAVDVLTNLQMLSFVLRIYFKMKFRLQYVQIKLRAEV